MICSSLSLGPMYAILSMSLNREIRQGGVSEHGTAFCESTKAAVDGGPRWSAQQGSSYDMFRACCAKSACTPPLSSSTSLMVRGSSLGTLPLSCADIASAFGRRSESSIMNDDGSSVITERVCSRTKEHDPVDIESDGNADLNM